MTTPGYPIRSDIRVVGIDECLREIEEMAMHIGEAR
jgi:hypothetical protein